MYMFLNTQSYEYPHMYPHKWHIYLVARCQKNIWLRRIWYWILQCSGAEAPLSKRNETVRDNIQKVNCDIMHWWLSRPQRFQELRYLLPIAHIEYLTTTRGTARMRSSNAKHKSIRVEPKLYYKMFLMRKPVGQIPCWTPIILMTIFQQLWPIEIVRNGRYFAVKPLNLEDINQISLNIMYCLWSCRLIHTIVIDNFLLIFEWLSHFRGPNKQQNRERLKFAWFV